MTKQPPKPRHTVERFPGGVRIVLPSEKKTLKIVGSGFLILYALFFGGLIVFGAGPTLFPSRHDLLSQPVVSYLVPGIFFLIFLIFVLGFIGYAIFDFLWRMAGREVIEIKKPVTLTISRQLFRWHPAHEYDLKAIKDLRPSIQESSLFDWQSTLQLKMNRKSGNIAFDYGAKTYYFGEDIDEAEAKMIITVLNEYNQQQP